MTDGEVREMAVSGIRAPGVVKVRLAGDPADVESVALILWAATGLEVLEQSEPYENRRDPGVRAYLTALVLTGRKGRKP